MRNELNGERPKNKYSLSFLPQLIHLRPFLPSKIDVLEVGCGEGYITELLVKNKCRVTGIDYHKESIIKTARLPGKYICVDLFDYKPKKKFSFIVLTEVLEHLKDDKKALKLIYSWLKRDGRFLISVPTYMKLTPRLKKQSGHIRHYKPEKLERMLKDAGFVIEKEKEWGSFIRSLVVGYYPQFMHIIPYSWLTIPGIIFWPIIELEAKLWPFKDSIIVLARKRK